MLGAIRLNDHQCCRRKLLHALYDRSRRRHHRVKAHVIMQADRVDVGVHPTCGEECRQCRRKPQALVVAGIVERLDSESIARQNDAPAVALPKRERKHSKKPFDAARAPRMIRLQNDFRVAV
jgi:hypothetical protein